MVDRHMIKEKGLIWFERLGAILLAIVVAPFLILAVVDGVGEQVETIQAIEDELKKKREELDYLKQQVESVQRAITGSEEVSE